MPDSLDAPHPHLRTEQDGAVLTVTLDNAARRNSQTPSLWAALTHVATTLPESVRVVVLRGEGPSFSAGLDRRMLEPGGVPGEPSIAGPGLDAAAREAEIAEYQRAFSSWRECPAVVVAAVQGHAIGAGFQLALAADLRVVADDVSFRMAEVTLGLVPDLGGSWQLTRILGPARALEACLTGRPIGAAEAVASGLALASVPVAELDATAQDLADAILQSPDSAVRGVLALVREASGRTFGEQLAAERAAQAAILSRLADQRS